MPNPDLDALRRAAESLLPGDDQLNADDVRQLLRAAGSDPEALAERAVAAAAGHQPLRECRDFQALLPAYRAQTLAPERRLLLEDHLHSCVACRRALHAAPAAPAAAAVPAAPRSRRIPAWALAAAAVLAVAVGLWAGRAGLLPGQSEVMATVVNSGGGIFAVSNTQVRPVAAGYAVSAGGELRTGFKAGAAMRLRDGSQVELGPRAVLTLTRGWTGTTLHLLRGQVIVRAAKQGWGRHLYVATADSRAAVKGTIFSMSSGLLGSRLAVVEGSVAFDYSRDGSSQSELVSAGQEATSSDRLATVPFSEEIGWSQDASQYLAMLSELSAVGKQLEAITPPPPRYSSTLVNAVPATAAIYAAIPNLGDTLSQTDQILQGSLGQSPALSQWLNQPATSAAGSPTRGALLEQMIQRMQQANGYLGNELVAAMVPGTSGGVVAMAAVTKPGLADFFASSGVPVPITIITNPANAGTTTSRGLMVWIGAGANGQMMVASHSGTLLQQAAALAQQSAPGPFLQTGLYQQIAPVYQKGANWLLAADLNRLHQQNVLNPVLGTSTTSKPQYLVAQSKSLNGAHATDLVVTFSGPRQGRAALLGAPGPMGGLAFISPNATLAASIITENPAALVQGMSAHAGSTANQQQFATDLQNLAAPLGGEFTLAQDGPVLPKPSWKLAAEVNDSVAMQAAVSQFVQDAASHQPAGHTLTLTQQTLSGQPYYLVNRDGAVAAAYTYAGSYLVAGSSLAQVQSALQTWQSGAGLPTSTAFQQQLPTDGRTNFSAVVFHNFNASLAPLAQQLSASAPAQWQPAIASLFANSTPGLVYAYGQPNQIEIASSQGVIQMLLEDLVALRLHAANGNASHP
ncbi:MAG TPA: FecR domain-containing protein [Terriglobales bacterium]|nr:FecR domain-containing protein [Terriglobales bacterium]